MFKSYLRIRDRTTSTHANSPTAQEFSDASAPGFTVLTKRANDPITKRFGKRVRRLRLERNFTQAGLAIFLGIDRSFISEVECGKKAMSLSYIETIAQGFGLSLSELFADL